MNLQATIDFDLRRFFRWWSKELSYWIPAPVLALLSDRSGYLIFAETPAGMTATFRRALDPDQPPVFSKTLNRDNPDAYRELLAQQPELQKADTLLRLEAGQGLTKTIYLPLAAQENLAQVVGFELDRYTPFKADAVYFANLPLGKTDSGQLRVQLVLTPRPVLDRLLEQLQSWGVQPSGVDYAEALPAEGITADYNLLPERFQPRGNRLSQSLHWLLNGLFALLLLAATIWPVWREGEAVERLKASIKTLEKETRLIEGQQQEIEAVRSKTQRLIDLKTQTPSLIEVLNELSKLLKDDTWLTHFQYTDKHLQVQGQSPAASALIGILEASPYFANVAFVSPLTQDKNTGRERFQISMDVAAVAETEPSEAADTAEETDTDANPADDNGSGTANE
ncbi:PilN domain-containing protein [Methylomonas sp. UP202]|uniref:PilN domain-containing protein n=1 Tax=Methylomonas sp. UP202 TaxID=3040943 RepID=UPI001438EE10|nr:PilN domain-containing protein [Methylomonas sp. UP202]NJA05574.1 fimbrial assembly protein [Methylococcaceae bacterium WWC4]WGS84625.1 PilN domain-containing protein [Methylomonas sp. UP202]